MSYEGKNSEMCTKNEHLIEHVREHIVAIKGNEVDMSKINAVRKKQKCIQHMTC